jgi:hypothetical protein
MWHLFVGCAFFLSASLGVVLLALVSADTNARLAHGLTSEPVSSLSFTADRCVLCETQGISQLSWEACGWEESRPYRED